MAVEDPFVIAADLLTERELETKYGVWTEFLFRYSNSDIVVLAYGDWREREDVLVRTHSTCLAAHYLWSVECDCREQLEMAFQLIVSAGSGLVVVLDQDGRANGHAAVMRAAVYAREHGCTQAEAYCALGYPSDSRSFIGAAVVLRKLGISSVRLMTNNPDKVSALCNYGLTAVPAQLIIDHEGKPQLEKLYENKALEGQWTRSSSE